MIQLQKLCGGYFLSPFNNISRLSRLKLINDQEFVSEISALSGVTRQEAITSRSNQAIAKNFSLPTMVQSQLTLLNYLMHAYSHF